MFTKLESEGYLEIDHRESPGFTPEQARQGRFGKTMPLGSKRFQFGTYKCCGCEAMVIVRPERTRQRTWCRKCDAYMCDGCALAFKITGVHKPFKQIIDEWAAKAGMHGNI